MQKCISIITLVENGSKLFHFTEKLQKQALLLTLKLFLFSTTSMVKLKKDENYGKKLFFSKYTWWITSIKIYKFQNWGQKWRVVLKTRGYLSKNWSTSCGVGREGIAPLPRMQMAPQAFENRTASLNFPSSSSTKIIEKIKKTLQVKEKREKNLSLKVPSKFPYFPTILREIQREKHLQPQWCPLAQL